MKNKNGKSKRWKRGKRKVLEAETLKAKTKLRRRRMNRGRGGGGGSNIAFHGSPAASSLQ